MRYILLLAFFAISFQPAFSQTKEDNKALVALFKEYTEDTYKLFPLAATFTGDYRYNDQLPVTFTDSYNEKTRQFLNKYLNGIKQFDRML